MNFKARRVNGLRKGGDNWLNQEQKQEYLGETSHPSFFFFLSNSSNTSLPCFKSPSLTSDFFSCKFCLSWLISNQRFWKLQKTLQNEVGPLSPQICAAAPGWVPPPAA